MNKKLFLSAFFAIMAIAVTAVNSGKALAEGSESQDVAVVNISMQPTPNPSPAIPAPKTPKPTATPTPKLPTVGKHDYPAEDRRCLSRGIKSVCPKKLCDIGMVAFCEVIQNMVDDDTGTYKDTIRYVLLMKSEFAGYDPKAKRSEKSDEIADYAMNAWMEEKSGDRTHRLLPKDAVHFSFSDDGKHIHVYDKDWNVVFESEDYQA